MPSRWTRSMQWPCPPLGLWVVPMDPQELWWLVVDWTIRLDVLNRLVQLFLNLLGDCVSIDFGWWCGRQEEDSWNTYFIHELLPIPGLWQPSEEKLRLFIHSLIFLHINKCWVWKWIHLNGAFRCWLALAMPLAPCGMWRVVRCCRASMATLLMSWAWTWHLGPTLTHLSLAPATKWPLCGTCALATTCSTLRAMRVTSMQSSSTPVEMQWERAQMTPPADYLTWGLTERCNQAIIEAVVI